MHEQIAVVGAGVMGADVAYTIARTNASVILVDVSDQALRSARARMRDAARLAQLMSSDHTVSFDTIVAHVQFTSTLSEIASATLVVENISEDEDSKRVLYGQLSELCSPTCIFAANTSAIPITRLASFVTNPTRVVGVHFMNPVALKPTVELIRGAQTSEDTLAATAAFLDAIGKQYVLVKDSPGFVSNRVLMLTINEAVSLLSEGVASAADIDRVFKECFGHPMGPLATADLIGLDTIIRSIEVLHSALADEKYRPCPLLLQLVSAGRLGRKSGAGIFDYS